MWILGPKLEIELRFDLDLILVNVLNFNTRIGFLIHGYRGTRRNFFLILGYSDSVLHYKKLDF